MLPVTTETWCIICYAVRPPRLSHPSAVKDICGELLSSTDKAAVMSEAKSPWGRWLMRIIGGTPTATPQPPAYPHTPSPTGPLHFTSSYSPVDSHYGTISTVIGCMGLLPRQVNWRGAEKQQLQYGDEVQQSMSHEGSESGAELLLWHSSQAAEPANKPTVTVSYFNPGNQKHARNILIRQQSRLSLFTHKTGNSVVNEEHTRTHTPDRRDRWRPSSVSGSGCSNSSRADPKHFVQRAASVFIETRPKSNAFQAIQRTRGRLVLKEVTLTEV